MLLLRLLLHLGQYKQRVPSDFYGKLSGLIPECGGIIDDSNFLENVIISFHIPINELGFFNKKLADATNGKIEVEVVNEDYFPM